MNRAVRQGHPDDPQKELKLDAFDAYNLKYKIWDEEDDTGKSEGDPRKLGDHVPSEIKEALDLPKDMSNYDIDFLEVRK